MTDIGHDWNQWTSHDSPYTKNDFQTTPEVGINTPYDEQEQAHLPKTRKTQTMTTKMLPLDSRATPASNSNGTRGNDNGKSTKRTQSSEVSARFRQRRKEKQVKMMMEVKEAEEKVNKLQSEARILSHENKVLRDLLSLRKDN